MRALWPHVGDDFATARHIVAAFYDAFPDEPEDEFLAELVVAELARGRIDVPFE
jgi:hypothetical protein